MSTTYIKLFTTEEEYTTFKASDEYVQPHVSYVTDTKKVHYNNEATSGGDDTGGDGGNYEAVDLGLSVKWASMNVGATSETDAGTYFNWGYITGYTNTEDAKSHSNYNTWSINNYKPIYEDSSALQEWVKENTITTTDNGNVLNSNVDAATVNMGKKWRMPTKTEWEELFSNKTDTTYLENYNNSGVNVWKIANTNDETKYIILPIVNAYSEGAELQNTSMWSSSINLTYPNYVEIVSFNNTDLNGIRTYYGYEANFVRGVCS